MSSPQHFIPQADSLLAEAESYQYSDLNKGLALVESGLAVCIDPQEGHLRKKFLVLKAWLLLRLGREHDAENNFMNILTEENTDSISLARSYYGLGYLHARKGKPIEGFEALCKAETLFLKLNDQASIARLLVVRAWCHELLGDMQSAFEHYDQSYKILHTLNLPDKSSEASTLYNLAVLMNDSGQRAEAINVLHKANELAEKSGNQQIRCNILQEYGRIYFYLKDYPIAVSFFRKALLAAKRCGRNEWTASALLGEACGFIETGKYLAAVKNLNQALRLFLERDDFERTVEVYSNLAAAYAHLNDLENAESCLRAAEGILTKYALTPKPSVIYYATASAIYESLGRHSDALQMIKKKISIEEEVYNSAVKSKLVSFHLRVTLEREKYKSDMAFLKSQLLEDKVEFQASQLVTQTELLAKFRDELREITRKYPTDHPGMREVKEKLKELPCKQIDWEKFEAEFAAVHPEFTKKLYERYAVLTPMEVKMCSLLRLNLKSHEIARLFCVTERAVEFHRLNIRKKCGIPKEQSLSVFLNNL